MGFSEYQRYKEDKVGHYRNTMYCCFCCCCCCYIPLL